MQFVITDPLRKMAFWLKLNPRELAILFSFFFLDTRSLESMQERIQTANFGNVRGVVAADDDRQRQPDLQSSDPDDAKAVTR